MAHVTNTGAFLALHERNVLLNEQIKACKTAPGNFFSVAGELNQLKSSIQSLVSYASLPDQVHIQILNTAIAKTEAKVAKLQSRLAVAQVTMPPAQQIAARAQTFGFISFYTDTTDALTGFLGNFHPCPNPIEFGGVKYSNSEAVFQSRKFDDQPQIFSQFTQATDGDTAVKIAHGNKMTQKRDAEWKSNQPHVNSIDAMMNALRAKFGQNPLLKEQLRATGSAYLVEHIPVKGRDAFWGDDCDGTGQNNLGICLMRLRAELGGTHGIVPYVQNCHRFVANPSGPTAPVQSAPQGLCNRCHVNPKYPDGNGGYYDFCRRNCPGPTSGPQPSLQGKCIQCHTRDKFVEGTKVHDYCGKSCAQRAGVLKY